MRCDGFAQPRLRGSGQGRQDQFGAFDGFRDIGGGERERDLTAALAVGNKNGTAVQYWPERIGIAPPESHIVSRFRRVRRGGVTSVATAKYCYLHYFCPPT